MKFCEWRACFWCTHFIHCTSVIPIRKVALKGEENKEYSSKFLIDINKFASINLDSFNKGIIRKQAPFFFFMWRASELWHTFKLVMIIYCQHQAALSLLSLQLSAGAWNDLMISPHLPCSPWSPSGPSIPWPTGPLSPFSPVSPLITNTISTVSCTPSKGREQ